MSETRKNIVLKNVAQVFAKYREEIKENWVNLLYQRKFIDTEEELKYFGMAFDQIINDFIEFLSCVDLDSYFKNNRVIAATVAYNDISFPKFITVFHLFEDSYLNILVRSYPDKDKLLEVLETIDRLHHQTIAYFAETYFSIHNDTIRAFAKLTTMRDIETGKHLERTRKYAVLLAKELKLSDNDVASIDLVGPLHDIGKVGLPDRVLAIFSNELTGKDLKIFQNHTATGAAIIDEVLGTQSPSRGFLKIAKEIILNHHENYDGSGYPSGLKGENIPFAARIFALADVYDMVTWKQTTRNPLSHKDAVEYIKNMSGVLFDPKVVVAFLNVEVGFKKIYEEFSE